MIRTSEVDAAIDSLDDDTDPATALADLLDHYGEWDWTDGSEHDPSDRAAVLESSGAWWYVYRGTEPDRAVRCASSEEASALLREARS